MQKERTWAKGVLTRWLERRVVSGVSEAVALRELLLIAAAAVIIIGLAFWITFRFVRPAPPGEFVVSTGADDGAYHLYAGRYAEHLAPEGVRVRPVPSSGSVENLERLADPASGTSVAFVQGGTGNARQHPGLTTLAALYYEPLWVFYRSESELTVPTQLVGKRIAIGPQGSGTRALVLALLEASKVNVRREQLLPLGGTAAAAALKAGRIDAAAFVAGADAPWVQDLLRARGVRLMSFSLAEAYSRRFPYLASVVLPRGMIDIADNIPPREITLVATTAYLVARQDFHPALVTVLLEAVARVHRGAGMFHRAGEFPAAREGDFPLSDDAQQFFKSGPPFLQRYLPFWVANLIQRMLILLVPLVAVAIPVVRFFPSLYGWRVRARVFRWYRVLGEVEAHAARNPDPARARELLAELEVIDEGVRRTRVPLAYSDYAYNLKSHVDLVRSKLQRLAAGPVELDS